MKHCITIYCLMAMLLFASCSRDHLYYASSDMATVLVETDWSTSGVNPNGVSVFAYNEADGSLYRRFPAVSAQQQCYIMLPEGDYTLVVMNDSPEEFEGTIDFTGSENINTFQARGVKDEQKSNRLANYLRTRTGEQSGEYCIVPPDTLAVSVVRGLHLSAQQMDYFYDRPEDNASGKTVMEVKTSPKPVISTVHIKAHVKGLKYARGTTISYLRGVAAGHCPGLEKNTDDQVAQSFILNNRVFDPGSDSDGTITAEFLSFGLTGNKDCRYYLDINFVLINGESHPLTFDVTDLISVDVSLSMKLSLNLALEIELPEVEGGGGEGGGFNPGVSEWEDEIVNVPM